MKDNFVEDHAYNFGKWNSIYAMVGIMVGFRILAFIVFKMKIQKVQ